MTAPGTDRDPARISADSLIPRASVGRVTQDDLDQAARRWGSLIILIASLLVSAVVLVRSSDGSKSADKAWNLLFIVVGYAGAYIFRDSTRKH